MPCRYLFGSDITAASASTIALNYGTNHIFFSDCTDRKMCDVPEADLYHAGFPCQPFSTAGKNMGVADTRGRVLHHVLKYITQKRPPLVLLENVKGLVIRHADVMNHVCSTMRRHGYFVTYKVLNACHQGVAHNRERVLILGFLAVGAKTSFDWPTNIATPPVTLFLDPLKPGEHFTNLPPASQTLARKHVEQALAETRLRKIDPAITPVSVDVDGVTLIPGAICSGSVIFSDGVTGKWIVDQSGRPGFTSISQPGYRPTPEDAQVFMRELDAALQKKGL